MFSSHPAWGLLVERLAIVSGIIGFFMSAAPHERGNTNHRRNRYAVFGMGAGNYRCVLFLELSHIPGNHRRRG
jgi:hypothetical protein